MFYRNIYEYLESQQDPDDIYYKYRKHREKMNLQLEAQAAGEYLYDEVSAALVKEIQKYIGEAWKKN